MKTFSAWRSKIQSLYSSVTFDGDADICQAFCNGHGVGEWDGAEGFVIVPWKQLSSRQQASVRKQLSTWSDTSLEMHSFTESRYGWSVN